MAIGTTCSGRESYALDRSTKRFLGPYFARVEASSTPRLYFVVAALSAALVMTDGPHMDAPTAKAV